MKKIIFLAVIASILYAQTGGAVEAILYDDTMLRLEGEIKKSIRKQAIYAHNVANAEVPGYKPIRFEEELKELEQRPGFTKDKDKVIIEEEMAKMTKNRMKHQTFLRLYNLKLEVMRKIVNQGKG